MSNKENKTLSEDQLRIERSRYDNLVQNKLLSLDFNASFHKKVYSFIYVTIFIGGIFTWCSSSNESNIYLLINTSVDFIRKFEPEINAGILVNLVILGLLCIPLFALCISIKNIRTKLAVESLLLYQKQHSIFNEFIKRIIEEREKIKITNIEELFDVIKKRDVDDISFTKLEFENYLCNSCKIYKVNFPSTFYDNLANLVLLNECIENTLVLVDSSTNSKFTMIISQNYNVL